MWSNRRMIRTSRLLMSIAGIDLMAKCRFGVLLSTHFFEVRPHAFIFRLTDRTIPKIPTLVAKGPILERLAGSYIDSRAMEAA